MKACAIEMRCSDIDLKLYGQDGDYFVELLSSPLWRRTDPKPLVLASDVQGAIKSVQVRSGDRRAGKQLGMGLFNALLPSPIDSIWNEARGRIADEAVLRLRLDIREHELMNIPWELVHDGFSFLALSTRTPVVRYLRDHASRRPVESPRPINVLLVSSTPHDLQPLANIEEEIKAVTNSLRNLEREGKLAHLETLEHATTEKLRAVLAATYDVVHFMGHGAFRDGRGYLVLEDASGNSNWSEGESVGDLFRNTSVRLLFLNACDTGIPASDDWLFGVAHAAHASSVPVVIAMRQTILDRAAASFAATFYGALAPNQPLELCLARAREATRGELGLDSTEWAIPVMFNNAPPGLLCSLWNDSGTRNAKAGKLAVASASVNVAPQSLTEGPLISKTDPTERSFLAFESTRAHEAKLLIAALHDRGIPTWQDPTALEEECAENAIRKTLEDRSTSSAILWLTPEIKSDRLLQLEMGWVLDRGRKQHELDGFFAVPVLAGGLDTTEVRDVLERRFSIEDLRLWNLSKVSVDPVGPMEAARVSKRVLDRRVAAIHRNLPEAESLRIELVTRRSEVFKPGTALFVDWVERFEGRQATSDTWEQILLPALKDIADAVQGHAPGRALLLVARAALPAAIALGSIFLARRGLKISCLQLTKGGNQNWSLEAPREASGFRAEIMDRDANARDVAVLVSVATNVELAFAASLENLPQFRGIVSVTKAGKDQHFLENPGQAHDVAEVVIEGMRNARERYRQVGCIHLFMAVPVGVAMMIGQLLNTFGLIQTYEHIPDDGVGHYSPAVLLYPSG